MIKFGLFSFLCICSAVTAQENCLKGVASHVTASYRGPEGVGYSSGYTSVRGFATPNWQRGFQPLLDIRGHIFDNGRTALNAGIGSRWNVFGNWVLGANLYYDFRDAKCLRAHQIGPGLELLSPFIDFRFNGYIPLDNSKKVSDLSFDGFTGIGNAFVVSKRLTAALPCCAGEIGVPLGPFLDPYLSVGPYYLFQRNGADQTCGGTWGGLGRLSLQLFDWLSVGGELSYDKEYKTRGNGFVSLSLPLGPNTIRRHGSRWDRWYSTPECRNKATLQRVMTKDVLRQEIIPTCSKVKKSTLNASCLFVSSDALPGGDGTFARPYNNINDALAISPCQCIYVLGGTYIGNIVPNECPLLGSGCEQVLPTVEGISVPVPPLADSYPILTNPGGIIIGVFAPISNDVSVRGFEFQDSLVQVLLVGDGTVNFNFSCNRFTDISDVFVLSGIDNLTISDNEFEFTRPDIFDSWQVTANNIYITDNTMTSIAGAQVSELDVDSTGGSVVIRNNQLQMSFTSRGFQVTGASELIVENNQIIADASLSVFEFVSTEPLAVSLIQNNTIENTLGGLTAFNFVNGAGLDNLSYTNNISGPTNSVSINNDVAGPTVCLSLDANTAGTFDLVADPGSTLQVSESLADVTMNNSGTVNITGSVNFDTGCLSP